MPFQKGHPGYKKKGTKHKATLLQEERRAIFDARVSQKWERTIDKLRPEYVADQFMGKAPDEVKLKGELIVQIPKEIAEKNDPDSKPSDNSKG